MRIRTVRHRGLKSFIESDDARGLRGDLVKRIRNMLALLISASSLETLEAPPGWRVHQLAGNRAGTWSLSVSGNWRITFTIDNGEIVDLNLEDYH